MLDLLNTYLLPFALSVPLALLVLLLATRPPPDAAPGPAPASAAPPAVLVIDDSAVARAKLRKLFESAGYRVEAASDGIQGLELLGQQRFSVLVTDLEMPRMDGFELIAAVQGNLATEELPIIAITGHDELQARVHDCGGLYGIFKKPWNDRDLLRRVGALATLPRMQAVRSA
ncbi:MAG TPA: response regulator [Burkholderiaceae bacterium]|jgi:CheY-like chemotaxis protein